MRNHHSQWQTDDQLASGPQTELTWIPGDVNWEFGW